MSEKAKKILEEWIEMEKQIDLQRVEVITLLQKKISEIQRQRIIARQAIKDSVALLKQFETKGNERKGN